jgi:hypothetical protein
VDLQNDFTTGDNHYPKNSQQTLHLLYKYSKTVIPKVTQSEGTSFAHKGGRGSGRSYNGNGKGHDSSTYDKKYWKDKECYTCHKMGHPATHCGKKSNSSRKICFTAVNHLADRTVPKIFKAFKEIYQYYLQRGFHIKTVHANGEFVPLKPLIESMPGGPMVNLASANEHVPEIERKIRVVKERCRATRHSLPYERIPKLMMIHIVLNVVKLLNFFPTKVGVSDTLSHKTIISGETLDFKKHLSLQIGDRPVLPSSRGRYSSKKSGR